MGKEVSWLKDKASRWVVGIRTGDGLFFLGLDSEGTGRSDRNLLCGSLRWEYDGSADECPSWYPVDDQTWAASSDGLTWTITRDNHRLVWGLKNISGRTLTNLRIVMPFSALEAGTVLIPAGLNEDNNGLGPWLLVAPDFGHLSITAQGCSDWFSVNSGARYGAPSRTAPPTGLNPQLRGQDWLNALDVSDYKPGRLSLQLGCAAFRTDDAVTFVLDPKNLLTPAGIDTETWKKIRRSYLNHWQPCGTWTDKKRVGVLANNVLSDPASISLWMYADPMLFWHEPVSGVDLRVLLKHSLDYWLDHHVSSKGHVNAFGHMHDLYVMAGACLLIAAWDYWTISQDNAWLKQRIDALHLMADFLLRRDVDADGIIESIHSGNADSLRDPDRADIWFEMMNFGHKNTCTNIHAYRAFLCLAEMLEAVGQPQGAKYYRSAAEALRSAFAKQFLSAEHGWFVSWISQDGKIHDYCHTFINGLAVAYGLVDPSDGRAILSRVVETSKSIGFTSWHLGVPGNLLPCRKGDMIGPRIGIDGCPIKDNFYWPDDLTEEDAFGYRYPDGTIHPPLVWQYLLGLQVAGLDDEADRILNGMVKSAQEGLFQNGIVNIGYGGAEHFYFNGRTCGYEGYLPECFNFLMACFTKDPQMSQKILRPMRAATS